MNCTGSGGNRRWGRRRRCIARISGPGSLVLVIRSNRRQSGEFREESGGVCRRGWESRTRATERTDSRSRFRTGRGLSGCRGTRRWCADFQRSLMLIDEAAWLADESVPGDASDAGGGGWGPVADEHSERQARILLGRMARRDGRVGADSGDRRRSVRGFPAGFGGGAGEGGQMLPAGVSCASSGKWKGRVFSQESIDAAMQDFEPLDL